MRGEGAMSSVLLFVCEKGWAVAFLVLFLAGWLQLTGLVG